MSSVLSTYSPISVSLEGSSCSPTFGCGSNVVNDQDYRCTNVNNQGWTWKKFRDPECNSGRIGWNSACGEGSSYRIWTCTSDGWSEIITTTTVSTTTQPSVTTTTSARKQTCQELCGSGYISLCYDSLYPTPNPDYSEYKCGGGWNYGHCYERKRIKSSQSTACNEKYCVCYSCNEVNPSLCGITTTTIAIEGTSCNPTFGCGSNVVNDQDYRCTNVNNQGWTWKKFRDPECNSGRIGWNSACGEGSSYRIWTCTSDGWSEIITTTTVSTTTSISTTTCPADQPYQETNPSSINTYCTAATGQSCNSPSSWNSSLSCHAAPGWNPFGVNCHNPYCSGCACITSTTITVEYPWCTDTDGGLVPNVKGTCTDWLGSSMTDTCDDNRFLWEIACSETWGDVVCQAWVQDCQISGKVCSNGACVEVHIEICNNNIDDDGDRLTDCADDDCIGTDGCCLSDSDCPSGWSSRYEWCIKSTYGKKCCHDSDGGKNIYEKGTAGSWVDYCRSDTEMIEYFCEPGNSPFHSGELYDCTNYDMVCHDGKCIEIEEKACIPNGEPCHENPSDCCEGVCNNIGTCGTAGDLWCGDGYCNPPENTETCPEDCGWCHDTDGGLVPNVKGTCTDWLGSSMTDTCDDNRFLWEIACSNTWAPEIPNICVQWIQDCHLSGKICQNGACVESNKPTPQQCKSYWNCCECTSYRSYKRCYECINGQCTNKVVVNNIWDSNNCPEEVSSVDTLENYNENYISKSKSGNTIGFNPFSWFVNIFRLIL